MRHVKHYDLYDNYGVAHHLKAKHNSCIVHVRSVPKGRMLVCSHYYGCDCLLVSLYPECVCVCVMCECVMVMVMVL